MADSIGVPIEIKETVIGAHTIRYVVAGKGEPLLLLHGANFGWGVWYPNIAEFAKYFTVYALDLPGAGRSSRVDYRTLDPEKDLWGVVERFVQERQFKKFSAIGCSVGGWLAMRLALRYPDRIQSLILENTVGFANYFNFSDKVIGFYPFAWLLTKTVLRPIRSNKRIEGFLRGIFYDKSLKLPPEFLEYFYETMATSHNLLFISRLAALNKKFVLKDKLPTIAAPVMIVWGVEDRIMPLAKNQENFSLLPKQKQVLVAGAGHVPSLEKPEQFNFEVLQFLNKK